MKTIRGLFYSTAPIFFIVLTLPILLVIHFSQKMKLKTTHDFALSENL